MRHCERISAKRDGVAAPASQARRRAWRAAAPLPPSLLMLGFHALDTPELLTRAAHYHCTIEPASPYEGRGQPHLSRRRARRPLPRRWPPGSCSAGLGAALQARIYARNTRRQGGWGRGSGAACPGGNSGGGGSNEQRSRSPRRPTKLWKCSITYCWPQMLLPLAVGAERLANSGNLNRSAAPDQTADATVDYTPFSTRGGQSQCCRGGRQSAGSTQAVVGLNAGLMSRSGGADCCVIHTVLGLRVLRLPSRGMWRASQAPHSDLAAQLARPTNSSASEVACKRVLGLRRRAQGLSRRWIPLLCQPATCLTS